MAACQWLCVVCVLHCRAGSSLPCVWDSSCPSIPSSGCSSSTSRDTETPGEEPAEQFRSSSRWRMRSIHCSSLHVFGFECCEHPFTTGGKSVFIHFTLLKSGGSTEGKSLFKCCPERTKAKHETNNNKSKTISTSSSNQRAGISAEAVKLSSIVKNQMRKLVSEFRVQPGPTRPNLVQPGPHISY